MTKKAAAKKSVRKSGRNSGQEMVPLAEQPHGGAIRVGSAPGNTPGTGRPPDAIRAAMRQLGATKGLPFLEDLLDGKVSCTLIGKCPHCNKESRANATMLKELSDIIGTSVDQRLKATEQAWKYGLGTKDEISVVSPDVQDRLRKQVEVISSEGTWDAETLLDRLSEVWT